MKNILERRLKTVITTAAWAAVKSMNRVELVDALEQEIRSPSRLPEGHVPVDVITLLKDALLHRT